MRGDLAGEFTALTEAPFRYEVLWICNGSDVDDAVGVDGSMARLIVFRPVHDPNGLVIAFRGARPQLDDGHANGFEADRACVLDYRHAEPGYRSARGHAHAGVCEYERLLNHVHDETPLRARGLVAWLKRYFVSRCLEHGPPSRILLVGLSLGASLAQVTPTLCNFPESPRPPVVMLRRPRLSACSLAPSHSPPPPLAFSRSLALPLAQPAVAAAHSL